MSSATATELRIVVVGTSGAGKTTLAKGLAAHLGLPHVELDAINWQPGWVGLNEADVPLFKQRVAEAVAAPRWALDGNYGAVKDIVWNRATDVVWLDYRRGVVMRRVIVRSIERAFLRKTLWNDNRETWRMLFRADHPIRWAWDTWARRRLEFDARIAESRFAHLRVHRLRHPREAAKLTELLKQG